MIRKEWLLWYARNGWLKPFRDSCFRKFCRANRGREAVVTTRYGVRMKTVLGDAVDNQIFVKGYFELGTSEVMSRLANRSDCLVDIGCNIGYYSCLFGTLNPNAAVYAIDPNPQMIERTMENVRLNQIVHAYAYNYGVASETATLRFYLPERRHSLGSFIPPDKETGVIHAMDVEVRPLGEIVPLDDIENGVLKIDAEGFELKILSGLTAADARKFNAVIFEFVTDHWEDAENTGKDIFGISWFREYEAYAVSAEGELMPFEYREDAEYNLNICLVRKEALLNGEAEI